MGKYEIRVRDSFVDGTDGRLESPGRISVIHNGIAIHSDTVVRGETFWHQPPSYKKHPDALPLSIQDDGDRVQFRSIWVRPFEPLRPRATER